MELSIVVCVLNEEATIAGFVAAVDAVLPSLGVGGHEYLFVDDGSSDGSWSTICALGGSRDDIVGVRLLRNVGKENALAAGLAAARGDVHVPMDVDLQDPPEVLEALVREWRAGAQIVLARRRQRGDSWFRRTAAFFTYRMLERGGVSIPRDVGDFRLMTQDTTNRFLALPERSRYNKGLLALVTPDAAVVEYDRPASRTADPRGSRQTLPKLVRLGTNAIVSFSTWPLQALSVLGFLLLGLSIVGAVLGVILRADQCSRGARSGDRGCPVCFPARVSGVVDGHSRPVRRADPHGGQASPAVLGRRDVRTPLGARRTPERRGARVTVTGQATPATGRIESWGDGARRVAIAVLLALGVGSIVVAAWSLARGGIGWDSRGDTYAELATRSLDSSWPLARAYEAVPGTSEFYGVFLYQFADVLHTLRTGSTGRLGPEEPVTYLYQGAATLMLSVISVTVLAVAIAVAFRSVLAAAFAWSLTLATPLWLGMSHVDFKDMPVAAGITLVTAGLVLSFVTEPPRKATLIGVLVAGCGGAIVLATRAGAVTLLVALVAGTVVTVLAWGIAGRRARATLPVLITSFSALACALAFTWATNPIARISMVAWLQDSIDVARNYPWDQGPIRVAGMDVRSVDLPWWYVPAWLGAQLPLLTIVAIVGGFGVLTVGLIRRRRLIGARTAIPLVPITLQAVVLPVGIVVSGAVLYDGIRHLLFIIPALIAIPAVGIAVLDRPLRDSRSRLRIVLPLSAVVIVAASLAASIRWAPYAYAFINPIAGNNRDGRSWELDYWGVSGREGVRRLREAGLSSIYVAPSAQVGMPWGAINSDVVDPGKHAGLYVFLRWNRAADFGCTVIFTIKRDGHVLGEGARCPAASQG